MILDRPKFQNLKFVIPSPDRIGICCALHQRSLQMMFKYSNPFDAMRKVLFLNDALRYFHRTP